jgi:hypothetical protein
LLRDNRIKRPEQAEFFVFHCHRVTQDSHLDVHAEMKPRNSAIGTPFFLEAHQLGNNFGRTHGCRGDQLYVQFVIHVPFEGAAGGFRAGKIPKIGKITALLGLHGLNRALAGFQENAFAIWPVHEGQTASI